MYKILFTVNNKQHLSEIEISGGIACDATILWDERVDGPIPELDDLECASWVDDELVMDQDKVDAKQVVENAKIARETIFTELKGKLENDTATLSEIRKLMRMERGLE